MKKSCEQIEKLLVDYADGELSPSESGEVAEHLAKCDRCQKVLKGLRRSLELAGVVWADGLEEIRGVGLPQTTAAGRFRWRRYAAVAAGILIAAGISLSRRMITEPRAAAPNIAEMERRIEEVGRAARLLAAAELLAEYPDAQSIAKQQYRYIVEKYPETPAATQAKPRIQ
ncbi:MAG TPA: zf-HC2 domain-containing protein [Sedimentisphaerales bacterium]|nr:zf-HC2 domain-containing protein [Sedimentisphaerales bacterium]